MGEPLSQCGEMSHRMDMVARMQLLQDYIKNSFMYSLYQKGLCIGLFEVKMAPLLVTPFNDKHEGCEGSF